MGSGRCRANPRGGRTSLPRCSTAGRRRACYVWKHLGSWPQSAAPERINDVVQLRILDGLGLPLGTNAVVEFSRAEHDRLVTLLFSTTIFGWSVGDDLYVVPDHGQHLLQTCLL